MHVYCITGFVRPSVGLSVAQVENAKTRIYETAVVSTLCPSAYSERLFFPKWVIFWMKSDLDLHNFLRLIPFETKKNCFQFVHYSIFAYSISKEFSFATFFFLIYSEIRLITKLVLASFRPENRQKIDLIQLCFGESGRFFENIENRPD